jgi:dCTP deaminase
VILGDAEILAAMERKEVVIEPFNRINLGTDTYDVTLGEWFYRESYNSTDSQLPTLAGHPVYNIYDDTHVRRVWGEPHRAQTLGALRKAFDAKLLGPMSGFGPTDQIIWVSPGETILAHTNEFIGGFKNHTTKMFSRSSIGRSLLGVCKCAGRGDVGYINRWTMEITSFSHTHIIPLKVGARLAQIEFQRVEHTVQDYTGRGGKYQAHNDIQVLMSTWTPDLMLPRLSKDVELVERTGTTG